MQDVQLFIVRVWKTCRRQGFQASVQRPGTDESACFKRPEELARFFERQAQAEGPACEPADAEEPP